MQIDSLRPALAEIGDALTSVAPGKVAIGWDGFVDRIHRVVMQRHADRVVWMEQIGQLRDLLMPGQSANAEWQLIEERVGGNAALLASALAPLVSEVQLIATLGSAKAPNQLAAAFEVLRHAGVSTHSCGEHAVTDALEFADGKVFLGQMNGLLALTWQGLIDQLGENGLRSFWTDHEVVCLTNWTMTPHMTSIWRGLQELGPGPSWLLVDLAEPSKRSDAELEEALRVLQQMPCKVLLGLNDRESTRVASVLGLERGVEQGPDVRLRFIQGQLGLEACVLHRKDLAIWCGQQETQLQIPVIASPRTLTGAGDHFNAGIVLGLLHYLSPLACLCLGHAVAAHWIQEAKEMTRDRLLCWARKGVLSKA